MENETITNTEEIVEDVLEESIPKTKIKTSDKFVLGLGIGLLVTSVVGFTYANVIKPKLAAKKIAGAGDGSKKKIFPFNKQDTDNQFDDEDYSEDVAER